MHITKLRLMGFKSFVEPTELIVEKGLTGVVGPNGCGKSNLLEALRWVMGETSYKSMRGSAMDDVIFSGTTSRPARGVAEVTMFIDNSARTAPAEFNDSDQIEVTRRIERESGSNYRINSREARARDVKILFEDAATGARSPALVRQGQIGEIVNAKPEQRRRILEDAAGIAGLHSRRHEADLRLRGAENNLARIGDILGQLKSQVDSLKRQARQARRYNDMSTEIAKLEAIQLFLTWREAQEQVEQDEGGLQAALESLGRATKAESEAARDESSIADQIQPLRDEEIVRAAVVARLNNEQTSLEKDAERARARCAELKAAVDQILDDRGREEKLVLEAQELLAKLHADLTALKTSDNGDTARDEELSTLHEKRLLELESLEKALVNASVSLSNARAERSGLEASIRERGAQVEKLEAQAAKLDKQALELAGQAPDEGQHAMLGQQVMALTTRLSEIEVSTLAAEEAILATDAATRTAREQREAATLALRQVETEVQTLSRLLLRPDAAADGIVDQVNVQPGFETALGAALGDDLEAPIGREGKRAQAPLRWILLKGEVEGSEAAASEAQSSNLPDGLLPLLDFVEAPTELHRTLRQVGLVEGEVQGSTLQHELKPGQRLVTREGALWRWDGFVAAADAPSAAAQRLAGRNRLAELQGKEEALRDAAEIANEMAERVAESAQIAKDEVQALRDQWRETQVGHKRLSDDLAGVERLARENAAGLAAVTEARALVEADLGLAVVALKERMDAVADLPETDQLEEVARQAQQDAARCRDGTAEVRAELLGVQRERERRSARRTALEMDLKRWKARCDQSALQVKALEQRLGDTKRELGEITDLPNNIDERRQRLMGELSRAEEERRIATDRVVEREARLKEIATALGAARELVSQCREDRARVEARLEGARMKRQSIAQHIKDALETTPEGCLELGGYTVSNTEASSPSASDLDASSGAVSRTGENELPTLSETEGRLARLKTERDRLGGVNLQAEGELDSLLGEFGDLDQERVDVEDAIARLRGGIAALNREGRKRLKQAFEDVNGHFGALFNTLFGGGEARLELVEDADDPLAGGLEIIAKPPGKQPTTLSLLSGGEQTLTALSLIFAVFLTNPSPICVLDEVDAPLDDANVDRFSTLMEKMAEETDTRFLVITHHPVTMSRMDRLFGVTMVEKGVSQLVSVDLAAAEKFLEAI